LTRSKHLDGLAQSFDRHWAEGVDLNKTLDQAQRIGGELGTAWRRELLHAGCQVRSTANRGVLHPQIASDRAYDHLARVEPNSDLHEHAVAPPHFVGVALHSLLHAERGVACSQRVILMRERRAKESHCAVAPRLIHRSFEVVNRLHHPRNHGIQQFAGVFGITVSEQLHGAFEVGEENCDVLALAFQGRPGGKDLLGEMLGGVGLWRSEAGRRGLSRNGFSALEAELRVDGQFGLTLDAGERQTVSTIQTKLCMERVLVLAPRTLH